MTGGKSQQWRTDAATMAEVAAFSGPPAPADGLTGLQYLQQNMTARKAALARAEWDAMDARGNLPADWPEQLAKLEKDWL